MNGKMVKVQLWDTAGQERFRNIVTAYFRGANGFLFVFDLTDRESFDELDGWFKKSETKTDVQKEQIKIALIGNKCD